jgi:collagenase-like PrtC family protease
MRIALPANYDPDLLPQVRQYDVFEIYGKLPYDVVGGGRPSYMSTPLDRKSLAGYVAAVHRNGMEFDYLLNAACLGNREWTRSFDRQLRELLDWLSELRVDTITIVAPILLQIIKKHYSHFKVKVGIYAQVDTVKRAQYWEEQGADGINLESFSINRDFEKLARIREAVSCDLPLIANHFCQPNCPYQIQHQNAHAHASSSKRRFLIDYHILQCNYSRFTHPRLMISAGWIRPEDIHYYEEIGYTTFKLIERNIPSEVLLQRARAYSERHFEGNFAEILFSWGFKKHPPDFSWWHVLRTFGPWNVSPTKFRIMKDFLQLQGFFYTQENDPVVIDSQAIPDDFIEHYKQGNCADRDCAQCGYCESIAREAVHIDPEFLDGILPMYEKIESLLVSGEMWGA